jgi:hypothetical protein
MATRQFPLFAQFNFAYRATLAGTPYNLRFRYSEKNQMVYLDVFDEDGAAVISGVGLTPKMYLMVGDGYFTLDGPSQVYLADLPSVAFLYVED